jgi:hypothetical protein
MDPLKTRLLSIKTIVSRSSSLVIYVGVTEVQWYEFTQTKAGVTLELTGEVPIDGSFLDAIDAALTTIQRSRRRLVTMILDDYYVQMQRFHFSPMQVKHLKQSFEIEIDQLSTYEYDYQQWPKEAKKNDTFLVYLVKKTIVTAIQDRCRAHGVVLRRLLTRYQSLDALIAEGVFGFSSSVPVIFVDVGPSRVRVFVVRNNVIKLFRRMPFRLADQTGGADALFKSRFPDIQSFVESVIASYEQKNTNQAIEKIYWLSECLALPKKRAAYLIHGQPIQPVTPSWPNAFKITAPATPGLLYGAGAYQFTRRDRYFNLVPYMRQLEHRGRRWVLGVFMVLFCGVFGFQWQAYRQMSADYNRLEKDLRVSNKDQGAAKRQMVEMRNRIKNQTKVMDHADLTALALNAQLPLDTLLESLVMAASPDIFFSDIKYQRNRLSIKGTASALNANYSFYMFLQAIEAQPFVGRVRYNLGFTKNLNESKFSIQVYLNDVN